MTSHSYFHRISLSSGAALLALLLLNGCGSTAPEKASSGPSGFSGKDIDELKPPAEEHKSPGVALTAASYETEVAQSKGLVLVDFWATWCGPCKLIAPILGELSVELAGKVKFANVDVDKAEPLARKFNIDSIPCLILFKDGKEVDRKIGALKKDALKAWLESKQ